MLLINIPKTTRKKHNIKNIVVLKYYKNKTKIKMVYILLIFKSVSL